MKQCSSNKLNGKALITSFNKWSSDLTSTLFSVTLVVVEKIIVLNNFKSRKNKTVNKKYLNYSFRYVKLFMRKFKNNV